MDPSGWTPLHSAAFEGHHNVCNLIMDTVVDKNPKDATGLTPLHAAAQEGHKEVVVVVVVEADATHLCQDRLQI